MKTIKIFHRFLAVGLWLAALNATAQTYTWTTIAGLAGTTGTNNGTGSFALFSNPTGITVDNASNVYVCDTGNDTIRQLTFNAGVSNWSVATIAGSPGTASEKVPRRF